MLAKRNCLQKSPSGRKTIETQIFYLLATIFSGFYFLYDLYHRATTINQGRRRRRSRSSSSRREEEKQRNIEVVELKEKRKEKVRTEKKTFPFFSVNSPNLSFYVSLLLFFCLLRLTGPFMCVCTHVFVYVCLSVCLSFAHLDLNNREKTKGRNDDAEGKKKKEEKPGSRITMLLSSLNIFISMY